MSTVPEADPAVRVYRGRTLDELLPRIREELGHDAVVLRQRDGLAGGVGGFFQKAFVEVEAMPGRAPLVDVVADAPADPLPIAPPAAPAFEAFAPMPEDSPAVEHDPLAALLAAGSGFAAELERAQAAPAVRAPAAEAGYSLPGRIAPPEPARRAPAAATALHAGMVERGVGADLAAQIVAEAVSHGMPFGSPQGLRRMARAALARRIAGLPPRRPGGLVVAFAGAGGSGKTHCATRLAAAYARGSDLGVAVVALGAPDEGAELRAALEPLGVEVIAVSRAADLEPVLAELRDGRIVVIDTRAVGPNDAGAARALGRDLRRLRVDEVHVAVPATLSAPAARELLGGLAALRVGALVLTHTDETGCPGSVLQVGIEAGLPFSYVTAGDALEPADPAALAAAVVA